MRLITMLIIALAFAAVAAAQPAAAEDKPVIAIETKALAATVTIDEKLKADPALYADLLAEGQRQAAKWRADADKELRENPDQFTDDGGKWSDDRVYSQRSVVGRYISILRDDGIYEGGAHPNSVTDTIIWDRDAQKRISIRPFFTETADGGPTMTALARLVRIAAAAEKIARNDNYGEKETIPPEKFAAENPELKSGIEPALLKLGPVTLAPSTAEGKSSGLTFHFSPYAIGAYAEGAYTAFVPWTAFKQFLTPQGEAIFDGQRPKKDAQDN
jgi:Protein of unknown function (DUF3298)